MKTYMAKKGEVAKKWHLVDATDVVLGRAATKIAMILMGKHRPEYTPNVDTGDFVIVINAEKIRVTGNNKGEQKTFQRFSRYPGGRKEFSHDTMVALHPDRVITEAVRRMLPKTKLAHGMIGKLKVYAARSILTRRSSRQFWKSEFRNR